MTLEEIAHEITELSERYELYHDTKLSREELDNYHLARLQSGNIIPFFQDGELIAYCEFYIRGEVCGIHSLTIIPKFRSNGLMRKIKNRMYLTGCTIFCGERNKNGIRYPEIRRRNNGFKQDHSTI